MSSTVAPINCSTVFKLGSPGSSSCREGFSHGFIISCIIIHFSRELCPFTVFLFCFVLSSLRALGDQVKRSPLGGTAVPYMLHKWIHLYIVIGDQLCSACHQRRDTLPVHHTSQTFHFTIFLKPAPAY